MSITSSTKDEIDDFLGLSSVKKVSCFKCGDSSVPAKKLALNNLQQLMKMGMRWICPSCLTCPSGVTSLKQGLNEFKRWTKLLLCYLPRHKHNFRLLKLRSMTFSD